VTVSWLRLISPWVSLFVKDVSFEGVDELWHVLESFDSSEAPLGSEQTRQAPAITHVAVAISLHAPSHFADSTEHRFNRVRRCEESLQVAFKTKSNDGDVSSRVADASGLMVLNHATVFSRSRFASA